MKVLTVRLKDGCVVATTAELILRNLADTKYKRVLDNQTGFPELSVE